MPIIQPNSSTSKILKRAMHLDDSASFRALLNRHGWPEGEWSDYELLVHAVRHNHRRIAQVLLDKGARVKNGRPRVNSPLLLAAAKTTAGWASVIVRLLSRGASVSDKNYKGETALHVAFGNKAPDEVIDVLLRTHVNKGVGEVFNKDLLGFVHVASTRSDPEMVRRLVETYECLANCQVSLKSSSTYAGYTPLHFAVDHGRLETTEFLLHHGADIYKQDVMGSTPLHLALELRNVEMIDLVLRYDEHKRSCVNNSGVSHFMAACAGSNEDLVTSYLRSPSPTTALVTSQINILGHHSLAGYTPLHFAAEFGRHRTVELLLSSGADCCALTPENVTPHMLAHQHHHQVIVQLLEQQCRTRRWFNELSRFVEERYHKIVREDEDVDSSSVEESVGGSDDVGRLSHDKLLSLFVDDGTFDVQRDSKTVSECDYDFLKKFDKPDEVGVDGLVDAAPNPVEVFRNDAKDFPLDLSIIRSSSSRQAPVYASLENVNHADQTISIRSRSPTSSVRISWSPSTSHSYFELTFESLNSDSAISLGRSFGSSRYEDSGVVNPSQSELMREPVSFYQADVSDYADPNADHNFEVMDYSAFAPVATSTPNKIDRGDSFDRVVDVNNNLLGAVRNVSFP